ncbi:hypothetical protein DMENIID0001_033780 [Sergentomyia squamirostris]
MQKSSVKNGKMVKKITFFENSEKVKSIEDAFQAICTAISEDRKALLLRAIPSMKETLGSCTEDLIFTKEGMQFCISQFIPLMVDISVKIQSLIASVAVDLIPILQKSPKMTMNQLKSLGITKTMTDGLEKLRDDENPNWHTTWCIWLKILLRVIITPKDLAMISSVLKIIEGGFKHCNLDIRAQSFICWKVLLEILVSEDLLIKRMELVAIPLYYTSSYNKTLAEEKFSTWWYFLCHIKGNIRDFNKVLVPFLQFCFEPYTTVESGRIMKEIAALSPGKKVSSLRKKVLCALVYMLGTPNDFVEKYQKQCGLEIAVDSIIEKKIFDGIRDVVLQSCQEATLMLAEVDDKDENIGKIEETDAVKICQNIWMNFLKLLNNEEIFDIFNDLMGVLEILNLQCDTNKSMIPLMQITTETVFDCLLEHHKSVSENIPKIFEICQKILHLFLDMVPNRLTPRHSEKISQLPKALLSDKNLETMVHMDETIFDIVINIDVRSIRNPQFLHIFFKNLMKCLKALKSSRRRCVLLSEDIIEKLLKWCLESFKKYRVKQDFESDWKPICEEFSYFKQDVLEDVYKKFTGEPNSFFAIFKYLMNNRVESAHKTETKDEGFIVICPPRSKSLFSMNTNLMTESQKEKMRKRADDVPALYNDLSQDTVPLSENSTDTQMSLKSISSSLSVIPPTPNDPNRVEKNKRVMRELERLKTDTVEGQNMLETSKRLRRKSTNEIEKKDHRVSPSVFKNFTFAETDSPSSTKRNRIGTLTVTRRQSVRSADKEVSSPKKAATIKEKMEKENPVKPKNVKKTEKESSPVPSAKVKEKVADIKKSPIKVKPIEELLEYGHSIDPFADSITDVNRLREERTPSPVIQKLPIVEEDPINTPSGLKRVERSNPMSDHDYYKMKSTPSSALNSSTYPTEKDDQNNTMPEPNSENMSTKDTPETCFTKPNSQKPLQPAEVSGTQDLFSETPMHVDVDEKFDLQNGDTQLKTQEGTLTDSMMDIATVIENKIPSQSDDTIPHDDEIQSTPVRIPSMNKFLTPKNGSNIRSLQTVKEKQSRRESSLGVSSPKFTSRAAQMISMTASSSSASKAANVQIKTTPTIQDGDNVKLLNFTTECPPANATPQSSILKRRRESNLDERQLKKPRLSFHDPPVTSTREYILDDLEISSKQGNRVNNNLFTMKMNLLRDSPPKVEDLYSDDNESDWEDFDDEEVPEDGTSKIIDSIPCLLDKRLKKGKNIRRNKNNIKQNNIVEVSETEQMNDLEETTACEEESEIIFNNENELLNYMHSKFSDLFEKYSNDEKMDILKTVHQDKFIHENLMKMTISEVLDKLNIS